MDMSHALKVIFSQKGRGGKGDRGRDSVYI